MGGGVHTVTYKNLRAENASNWLGYNLTLIVLEREHIGFKGGFNHTTQIWTFSWYFIQIKFRVDEHFAFCP